MLKKLGVSTTYFDPLIGAGIEELIRPETAAVFMEAPGSQSFEVHDVPAIVAAARQHNLATLIDNTWATPLYFRAHDFGVDISIEAGTKYLSGHSDLLLGLVSANERHWPNLRRTYDSMAMLPGAEDCFLALRGLRTMGLRLREAERRGLDIARWMQQRPEVATVLHPAFPSCPGHEFWKRDFKGSSGLFSVLLKDGYSRDDEARFLNSLALFSMGYSWGGFESLIIPFNCAEYRTATRWDPNVRGLRLQIGLEDMDDIRNDLEQAFAHLNSRA
jgi:cystathionine beta-lyase